MDRWYNTGGFLSSSSLSASAQPFMVDRFSVNPNPSSSVDSNEPLIDYHGNPSPAAWLNSYAPSTMPDWSAHNYAVGSENGKVIGTWNSIAAVYHPASDALRIDAPRPLSGYSPYVQPRMLHGNHMMDATDPIPDKISALQAPKFDGFLGNDYNKSVLDLEGNPNSSGFWSGLEVRVPGNEGEFGGNHCTGSAKAAEYRDQEDHAFSDLRPPGEASHSINMVGWEKHFSYPSAEHADGESALANNFTSKPGCFPDLSLHLEKHTSPCSPLAWNSTGQHGLFSDSVKPSPLVAIKPLVGSSSSAVDQDSVSKNRDENDAVANMHFASAPFSSVREPHPMGTFDGKWQFDLAKNRTQLGSNVDGTEKQSFATDDLLNKKHMNGDGPYNLPSGEAEIRGPQCSLHKFDLALNRDHAASSYTGSDHFQHAEDLRSCRGLQESSPLAKVSGAADYNCTKALKESKGLNPQELHVLPYDVNCPMNSYFQEENSKLCVDGVPKPDSSGIFDGWQKLKETAVIGSSDLKELQFSAGMPQTWKESASCDFAEKSSSNSCLQHSESMQQQGCAFEYDRAQAFDLNKNINIFKNAPSLHSVEHVSSSSKVDVPQEKTKWDAGVLVPSVDVHMLVSTIYNLSELLLIYGANSVSDLGEGDLEILKKVVNNISALQNDGQMTTHSDVQMIARQELLNSKESTSLNHEDLSQLCKNSNTNVHVKAKPENHRASDEKQLSADSICKDESNADLFRSWDRRDVFRNDDMTQAIKEILSENFHDVDESHPQISLFKNLWLETEAKLCCITYKERFNRAKVELESLNSLEGKGPHGNSLVVENTRMSSISSGIEDIEPLERRRVHSDSDISTKSTNGPSANETVNDVLARFKILTGRFDGSSPVDPVDPKKECSKVFPDLNGDDKLVSREHGESFPYIPRDLPVKETSGEVGGVDASVMARMEILKRRDENLILYNMKWPQHEIKLEMEKFKRLEGSTGSSLDVENNSCSSISIDSRMEDKPLLKTSPDMSTHNSLVIDPECTSNEMLARYRIWTGQVTKSRYNISSDSESDDTNGDPPMSDAVNHGDDIGASVMVRMDVLRRRDRNLIANKMESPWPEAFALGSAIRSDYLAVNGDKIANGCPSENSDSVSMHVGTGSCHGESTVDVEGGTAYDFIVHSIQKHGSEHSNSAGHQESSSSEWEDVVKEDYSGHI